MPQFRILVTGADTSAGRNIISCLALSRFDTYIIAAGTYHLPDCTADQTIRLPAVGTIAFVPLLIQAVDLYRIDLILPGDPAQHKDFSRHTADNPYLADRVVLGSSLDAETFLDRYATIKWLRNNSLDKYTIPTGVDMDFDACKRLFKTPFFAKHRSAHSNVKSTEIHTAADFWRAHEQLGENLLAQRKVGSNDKIYSVLVFGTGNGSFVNAMCVCLEGWDDCEVVTSKPGLQYAALILTEAIQPKGPMEFVFRLFHGLPQLLRVNPYISPSAPAFAAFGFNIIDMCIESFVLERRPKTVSIRPGRAKRHQHSWVTV